MATEAMRDRLARQRAKLDAIRRERGCIDCGTREGRLDFDHRPGEIKRFVIGAAVGRSWESILVEIAKCEVRCVRCHARRHGVLQRPGVNSVAEAKAMQTHCIHGHELTEANTYTHPQRGTRHCRQCDRDRQNRRYATKKQGVVRATKRRYG